jgi:natural product precursor
MKKLESLNSPKFSALSEGTLAAVKGGYMECDCTYSVCKTDTINTGCGDTTSTKSDDNGKVLSTTTVDKICIV